MTSTPSGDALLRIRMCRPAPAGSNVLAAIGLTRLELPEGHVVPLAHRSLPGRRVAFEVGVWGGHGMLRVDHVQEPSPELRLALDLSLPSAGETALSAAEMALRLRLARWLDAAAALSGSPMLRRMLAVRAADRGHDRVLA